jgi:phage FluMu protein Com
MPNRETDTNGQPFRCHCGNLLARLVPGGVELKCRRCKRTVVISLEKERQAANGKATTAY